MRSNAVIVLAVFLTLFLIGCNGNSNNGGGSSPTTPFLGGNNGFDIDFVEGSPPDEVFDKGTFDFSATVKIKNQGEFEVKKEEVKIDLVGFLPEDFGVVPDELNDVNPEEDLLARIRDGEGNIIEPTEVFVNFPSDETFFNFDRSVTGNTLFVFRADVCYKYQTKALSRVCVLRNLIDEERDERLCDPSESKTVHSSAAPVKVSTFRQSLAGQDKISFSFDITHVGPGEVFREGGSTSAPAECPNDARARREHEDWVKVTVESGLPNLRCVGLEGGTVGFVNLVDDKRTVTCTQELDPNRNDFESNVEITVDYNYMDHAEKDVLVKHLLGE